MKETQLQKIKFKLIKNAILVLDLEKQNNAPAIKVKFLGKEERILEEDLIDILYVTEG